MNLHSPLAYLPPEVLNDVLRFSGGRSIIMLYQCGDSMLNFNITRRGGAKTFDFTFKLSEEVCIPPLIYRISTLEHLILISAHYLQRRAHIEGWEPEKLPTSLKSIHLSLFTHNQYLHDHVGPGANLKPLSTLFPMLNSLLSAVDELEINTGEFSLLPNLTHLNLGNALKASDICLLPRLLTDLSIQLSQNQSPELDPSFPPSLTRLVLKNLIKSYFLRYLPEPIESLELVGSDEQSDRMKEEWSPTHIVRLPSTIKHLRMVRLPISWDTTSFGLIGRQIESLSIVGGILTGSSADILNAIPPSIKILADLIIDPDGTEILGDAVLKAAQHSLSHLRASNTCFKGLWEAINWYPPQLTTLEAENTALMDCNPPLPNSITKLSFESPPYQGMVLRPLTMPAALITLQCPSLLHPDAISSLSFCPHLTSVSLVLSPYDIPKLPKTLKTLKWKFDDYEVQPFPQDLSFERWELERLELEANCTLHSEMRLFSTLPTTLEHLNIEFEPYSYTAARILRLWSNLTHLHTLRLSSIRGCVDEDLQNLPPNLLSLNIQQFTQERLTPDCFLKMPSKLVSLCFPSCLDITDAPIKIDHLKHLDTQSRDLVLAWT